jgi:hypothetical protein
MIRRPESFNRKSLHILILAVVSLAVIFTAQQQQAQASTSAFDQGWKNGESDYKTGQDKNPRCNSDIEASTCASYRLGYEAGWASASMLWPEDRQEALGRQ